MNNGVVVLLKQTEKTCMIITVIWKNKPVNFRRCFFEIHAIVILWSSALITQLFWLKFKKNNYRNAHGEKFAKNEVFRKKLNT